MKMGNERWDVENLVYGHISKSLDKFCRVHGTTLLPWYHNEARWLVRTGDELIYQVEIQLEGGIYGYRLVFTPAVFERGIRHGWRFGDSRFINILAGKDAPWPFVDVEKSIKLSEFMDTLEASYVDTVQLASDPVSINSSQHGVSYQQIQQTYDKYSQLVADKVAKDLINNWRGNESSVDASFHANDIRRNLAETNELEQHPDKLNDYFYQRIDPQLGPKN